MELKHSDLGCEHQGEIVVNTPILSLFPFLDSGIWNHLTHSDEESHEFCEVFCLTFYAVSAHRFIAHYYLA